MKTQGDKIISALIGLVGAVSNNGKSKQTDQVIREAFFNLTDSNMEEETVRKIHEEKFHIAPDCATCQNPCGNTSDYDMTQYYAAGAETINAKQQLVQAIRNRLMSSMPTSDLPESVYRGIAYLGYELEPEAYEKIAQEL